MTILQQPDALSFSMNLKPFKINTAVDVAFALRQGGETLLTDSLSPDADDMVELSLRDVIHDRLSCAVPPDENPYVQPAVAADFTAVFGSQSVSFRVIRGGVDGLSETVPNFVRANFLTWQPNVKPVTYSSPEFLSYYAVDSGCSLKVKAYFTDAQGNVTPGTEKTICSLTQGVVTTVSVQYAVIAGLYSNNLPAYYDVWVASGSTALTYIQRYYADALRSEEEQWFFFENSLGGIDTFRAFGAVNLDSRHTHNIAEIDDVSYEYRVDTERKWSVNTGHIDMRERRWLLDFFPSAGKYIYTDLAVRRIVLVDDSVAYRFSESPSSYAFTFRYADALPLLNLPRHELPVEMLDITVPDVGSFTLPPRLLEFTRQPLSEGVLFPVQSPYSEEWAVTSLGGIADYVRSLIHIPSPGLNRAELFQVLGGTPRTGERINPAFIDLSEFLTGSALGRYATLADLIRSVDGKLDTEFFARVFTVYDEDGNPIVPNTYEQAADNLQVMVGLWTEKYLSALGHNEEEGEGGGTGILDLQQLWEELGSSPWDAKVIHADHIPGLDASKIIRGVFNQERIPQLPISKITGLQDTLDGLQEALDGKLDTEFFSSVFTVYDEDGHAITPNTYEQVADNLRVLVGTWTNEYLSALGRDDEGGGTGILDIQQLWEELGSSPWTDKVISDIHIPQLGIPKVEGLQNTLNTFALKARKIQTGNGLQGGGDLQADRTLSVKLRTVSDSTDNSGLKFTDDGSLYVYVEDSLTSTNQYRPLSAYQGKLLADRIATLEALFEVDPNGDVKTRDYEVNGVTKKRGLYSESFVSVLGANGDTSGGGTGVEMVDVWRYLHGTSDDPNHVINAEHIPAMSTLSWSYGSVAGSSGSTYNGKAQKSFVIPKTLDHIADGSTRKLQTIAYDTINKKFTKTVDGTTSDLVTAANIVKDFIGSSSIGAAKTPIYWSGSAFKAGTALKNLAYKDSIEPNDVPDLSWNKITSDKPTTLAGYGITDTYYTTTQSDARFYALYGGTKLNNNLSSTNRIDLDDYSETGSYYCKASADSAYIDNRPTTGNNAFRMWVSSTTGTSASYRRQRFQNFASYDIYERTIKTDGTWNAWVKVQGNIDSYLPLAGGTMTGTINSQIVQPKTTDAYTLGGSSNRWSNVYSVLGNFSGLITASGGVTIPAAKTLKIGNAVLSWDSTNNCLKISDGTANNTTPIGIYATGTVSALGANTSGGGGTGSFEWQMLTEYDGDANHKINNNYLNDNVITTVNQTSTTGYVSNVSVGSNHTLNVTRTAFPTASSSTLGMVKVGNKLSISDGVLNLKSSYVSSLTYSSKKFSKATDGGTASDLVSASTIVADGGGIKTIKINGTTQTVTGNSVDLPAYPDISDLAKKDGSNATGTWGISISGNAATATKSTETTRLVAGQILTENTVGDANTMTIDNGSTVYGIITNYHSNPKWSNMPSNYGGTNSYGGVVELKGKDASLKMQFAWSATHNEETSPTKGLWFRARANKGYVSSDWKQVAFATDLDAYLKLAGNTSSTPMTGNIFFNNNIGLYWKNKPATGETAVSIPVVILNSSNNLHIGTNSQSYPSFNTYLSGNNVYIRGGVSGKSAINCLTIVTSLDSSENVIATVTANQGLVIPSAKTLKIGNAVLSWDGTNNCLKISDGTANDTTKIGIYATGTVSALGANTSGGGGTGIEMPQVWEALAQAGNNEPINYTHIQSALTNNGYMHLFSKTDPPGANVVTDVSYNSGTGTLSVTRAKIVLDDYLPLTGNTSSTPISNDVYFANNKSLVWKVASGSVTYDVLKVNAANQLELGLGTSTAGKSTYIDGHNIYLRYGSSQTLGLTLSSSGAVTIKNNLTVDGTSTLTGAVTANHTITATGNITAAKFIKSDGTSTQFLKANGDVDDSTYLKASDTNLFSTLSSTSTTNLTVKVGDTTKTVQNLYASYLNGYQALGNDVGHIVKQGYINVGATTAEKWYRVATIASNTNPSRYLLHISTFYVDGNGKSCIISILCRGNVTYFWHEIKGLAGNLIASYVRLYYNTNTDNVEVYVKFPISNTTNRTVVTRVLSETKRSLQSYDSIVLDNNPSTKVEPTSGWSYTAMTYMDYLGSASGVTTAVDNTSTLYLLGVPSDATSTIKRNTQIRMFANGELNAPLLKGGVVRSWETMEVYCSGNPYIDFHRQNSSTTTAKIMEESNGVLSVYNSIGAASEVTASSDERLKTINGGTNLTIKDIAEAPAIKFLWNDKRDEKVHIGSIAQYWEKALPEAVSYDGNGIMSLNYGALALVSAISIARGLMQYEDRLARLEKKNKRLERRISALERRIACL